MRNKLIIILLITGLTGILRWQSWFIPFNRDEGGYAYVASQLFTPGFVMYRDAFEHKPPVIDFIYWSAFRALGQSDFSIRTLSFVFSVITALMFYRMTRRFLPTVLLVLLSNTFFLSGNGSNVEVFLSPLLLGGYWLILNKRYFIAGLVLGVATILKPVAITNIAVAYLLLPFLNGEFWSTRIRFTVAWVIPVVTLFVYEWFSGGFADFITAVFKYNTFYVQYGIDRLPYGNNIFRFLTFPDLVLIVLVFGTAIIIWHKRKSYQAFWRPLLWSLAIIAGAKILSREADHYYIPLLPALALLLLELPSQIVTRLLKLTLCLYLVLHLRFLFYSPKSAIISALDPGQLQIFEAREVGERAKRVATKGDVGMVSLIGEPELLFYAGLPSANRYFNTFAIDYFKDSRQIIINSLAKRPVVVMAYPGIIVGFEDKLAQLGYKKDTHSYFAPVYWRADAASKLKL